MLKKALKVSFFLYLVSLLSSMAGMEIFGWLTFALGFAVAIQDYRAKRTPLREIFFPLGADYVYLAFLVIVILGYLINADEGARFSRVFGGARWGILMYGTAYAIRSLGLREKALPAFMCVAAIASVHGYIEFFTGWNFTRNRAIDSFTMSGYPRATGLFSVATTFANAAALTICFPIAVFLMKWKRPKWQAVAIYGGAAMLSVAIALSFTRAAWISILCSVSIMTLLISFRKFVIFAVGAVIVLGTFVAVSPAARERIVSVVDMKYVSNSERLELWRANWWMFKEHPILGLGLNDNERRTLEYNTKYGYPNAKLGNAHNTYLQFLSGTGILGLTAYLIFVTFYLVVSFKLFKIIPKEHIWPRVFVLGAIGAQIGLHVGGMMDANFKDSEVQHQYIAVIAAIAFLRMHYLKARKLNVNPALPQ